MSKPREWTICGGSVYPKDGAPIGYLASVKIDVIEKSAYDRLATLLHNIVKEQSIPDFEMHVGEARRFVTETSATSTQGDE